MTWISCWSWMPSRTASRSPPATAATFSPRSSSSSCPPTSTPPCPAFIRFQFAFARVLGGDLTLPVPTREDAVESITHGYTDTLRTLRQQFKRREWAMADDWARQVWWNLKSFKYATLDVCWLLRRERPTDPERAALILEAEGLTHAARALTEWPDLEPLAPAAPARPALLAAALGAAASPPPMPKSAPTFAGNKLLMIKRLRTARTPAKPRRRRSPLAARRRSWPSPCRPAWLGLFCLTTAYKIYASNQAEKRLAALPAPLAGPAPSRLRAPSRRRDAGRGGPDASGPAARRRRAGGHHHQRRRLPHQRRAGVPRDRRAAQRLCPLRLSAPGRGAHGPGRPGHPARPRAVPRLPGPGPDADVDDQLDARHAGRVRLHRRRPLPLRRLADAARALLRRGPCWKTSSARCGPSSRPTSM